MCEPGGERTRRDAQVGSRGRSGEFEGGGERLQLILVAVLAFALNVLYGLIVGIGA